MNGLSSSMIETLRLPEAGDPAWQRVPCAHYERCLCRSMAEHCRWCLQPQSAHIDVTAESKRTLDRAFPLKTRCANNKPPEVIAALVVLAIAALATAIVTAARKGKRR